MLAHLHPLLVHWPICILLLAAGITLSTRWRNKATRLGIALPMLWFLGAASAVFACTTGWFSAQNLGQDALLPTHQWLGFGTAGLAIATWFFRKKILPEPIFRLVFGGATGLLALATLHFGTSLTHGEGYLFKNSSAAETATNTEKNTFPATDLPPEPVPPAPTDILQMLGKQGIVAAPVAVGSNYLSVDFVNAPAPADSTVRLLEKLAPQIVWLNLGGTNIGDTSLISVGKLLHLTRLQLSKTNTTDLGLPFLANLKNLQYLNLTETKVTAEGLAALRGLPVLQKIYLFQSAVQPSDWPRLREIFPKTELDSGGYRVENLATDTVLMKALRND